MVGRFFEGTDELFGETVSNDILDIEYIYVYVYGANASQECHLVN